MSVCVPFQHLCTFLLSFENILFQLFHLTKSYPSLVFEVQCHHFNDTLGPLVCIVDSFLL